MQQLVIYAAYVAIALCPTRGTAADLGVPVPDKSAYNMVTQMLGGIPGSEEEADITIKGTFSLPEHEDFAPVDVLGAGTVHYHLSGQVIRVRGEELPALDGDYTDGKDNTYRVVMTGIEGTIVEGNWGGGSDITLTGLGLQASAYNSDDEDERALATITQKDIELTTGSVTIGDKTYRGKIAIKEQRVILVGTFPMPKTGIRKIDRQIKGKDVLIRLRIAPTEVQ